MDLHTVYTFVSSFYESNLLFFRYGEIFLIKLGSYDIVVLNSREVIHEALVKQSHIFSGRPLWQSFQLVSQGKGVVFNSPKTLGNKWKTMKATLVRHLNNFIKSSDNMQDLNNHVIREAMEMIQLITKQNKKSRGAPTSQNDASSPDLNSNIINITSANIACMTVFGQRFSHDNNVSRNLCI